MNYSDEDDIQELADVVPEIHRLDGDKIQIDAILNIPLIFLDWEIGASRYHDHGENSERLTLQFVLNGERRIAFTGSKVLIKQVRSFEEKRDKNKSKAFRATIRRIDKHLNFCRTK